MGAGLSIISKKEIHCPWRTEWAEIRQLSIFKSEMCHLAERGGVCDRLRTARR
jgi:hypothetical protein